MFRVYVFGLVFGVYDFGFVFFDEVLRDSVVGFRISGLRLKNVK